MLHPAVVSKNFGLTDSPPPTSQYSENIMVTRLPCIGRIHFVKDKGGMLSLGFVVLYWIYGTWCSLTVILLPHWRDGQSSDFMIFLFCLCSIMCISSLIRVSTLNPGRVPLISEESSFGIDYSHWELCPKCNRKRPPRAHHCRRCQQCVLRMDHHCPWINNCVGEENHWAFMQLLFWAFCLGSMAFLACQLHFWYYPPCVTCNKDTFYIKHGIWFNYLLTILAVFMMLFQAGGLLGQYYNISMESFSMIHSVWLTYLLTAMGVCMALVMAGSLIGQHFMLLLDRTTLENMRDPNPDVTKLSIRTELKAYREICGNGPIIFWLFPCRRRRAKPSYLPDLDSI